jgi:NAD+ synthase (glutamine-hydrolysing)
MVDGYVATVSQAIDRELNWERDDVALQNIQARARGPGIWLLANLRHALLLTTSNRSEAAVGYATMDGDTSGGLSPIAGIDKAFLLHWLEWMEKQGPCGLGPIPELAVVNAQAPTAELRPQAAAQTDEQDLMPYKVLDAIERAAIRDKQTPLEVFRRIEVQFAGFGRDQLGEWVERFFRLWCRNQWKRERYAPSFHLDDENLDPKTWCRFPILSGGYERELRELREFVAAQP